MPQIIHEWNKRNGPFYLPTMAIRLQFWVMPKTLAKLRQKAEDGDVLGHIAQLIRDDLGDDDERDRVNRRNPEASRSKI